MRRENGTNALKVVYLRHDGQAVEPLDVTAEEFARFDDERRETYSRLALADALDRLGARKRPIWSAANNAAFFRAAGEADAAVFGEADRLVELWGERVAPKALKALKPWGGAVELPVPVGRTVDHRRTFAINWLKVLLGSFQAFQGLARYCRDHDSPSDAISNMQRVQAFLRVWLDGTKECPPLCEIVVDHPFDRLLELVDGPFVQPFRALSFEIFSRGEEWTAILAAMSEKRGLSRDALTRLRCLGATTTTYGTPVRIGPLMKAFRAREDVVMDQALQRLVADLVEAITFSDESDEDQDADS